MLETLRTDFHRLPDLLALGPPEQPADVEPIPEVEEPETEGPPAPIEAEPAAQLGLF
jgi:hypothetical protein